MNVVLCPKVAEVEMSKHRVGVVAGNGKHEKMYSSTSVPYLCVLGATYTGVGWSTMYIILWLKEILLVV